MEIMHMLQHGDGTSTIGGTGTGTGAGA